MSVLHTIPKPDFKNEQELENYYHGMFNGISQFAYWKNGDQLVGTGTWTLKDALNELLNEKAGDHDNLRKQLQKPSGD